MFLTLILKNRSSVFLVLRTHKGMILIKLTQYNLLGGPIENYGENMLYFNRDLSPRFSIKSPPVGSVG